MKVFGKVMRRAGLCVAAPGDGRTPEFGVCLDEARLALIAGDFALIGGSGEAPIVQLPGKFQASKGRVFF